MKGKKLNYVIFAIIISCMVLLSGILLINSFYDENNVAQGWKHYEKIIVSSKVYRYSGYSSEIGTNCSYTSPGNSGEKINVGSVSVSLTKGKVYGTASEQTVSSSGYVNVNSGKAVGQARLGNVACALARGMEFTYSISVSCASGFQYSIDGGSSGSGYLEIHNGTWQYDKNTEQNRTVKFCPRSYTDTYNANGGSIGGSASVSRSTDYYNSYNVPPTPTRQGYHFTGWYTAAEGGSRIDSSGVIKKYAGGQSFYAHWEINNYKVRFNGNGATSGSMPEQSFTYGTAQNLSSNKFYKTSHIFTGWKYNGTIYTDGQSVNNLTTTNDAVLEFVAQWEEKKYTLNFKDGNNSLGIYNAVFEETFNQEFDIQDKEGHYFGGWESDGTTYPNDGSTKDNITVERNGTIRINPVPDYGNNGATKTFNGVWTKKSYVLIFKTPDLDENGELKYENGELSWHAIRDIPGQYGQTLNDIPNITETENSAYKRKGYKLIGWALNKDEKDKDKIYKNSYTVKDLGDNGVSVEFYAIWEPIKYYVKFDSDAHIQEFEYDTETALEENPFTKPGYHFTGWIWTKVERKNEDGVWIRSEVSGEPEFADKDEEYFKFTNKQEILNLTTEDGLRLIFEPQWEANKYTIKFMPNYGSEYIARYPEFVENEEQLEEYSQGCTYDVEVKLKKNPFVKVGYMFIKWTKQVNDNEFGIADEDTLSNLTTEENGEVRLYAQWRRTWSANIEPEYTVKPVVEGSNIVYNIRKAEDLAWLSREMQIKILKGESGFNRDCVFNQTANIDLKGSDSNFWMPIGNQKTPFEGKFNGNGYTISNLYSIISLSSDIMPLGMFGYIKDADIENVNITSSYVISTTYNGFIAARSEGGKVLNCSVFKDSMQGGKIVGGMVGYASGTIFRNCKYGDILGTGDEISGGIVGYVENNQVTITNCYVKTTLKGEIAGGMVGYAKDCGVIISNSGFVGAVGGEKMRGYMIGDMENPSTITIQDCFAEEKDAEAMLGTIPKSEHMSGKEGVKITDCFLKKKVENNIESYLYEGEFKNWVISFTTIDILPNGFSWLGNAGTIPFNPEDREMFGFKLAKEYGLH